MLKRGVISLFIKVLIGAFIPLFGTTAGALIAFASLKRISDKISSALSGFAGGVMLAASVWSLLLPAIELSSMGKFSFVEPGIGLIAGGLMMLIFSERINKKYNSKSGKEKLLYFAVTLHNVPEGMAIGAAYSAYICTGNESLALSALLLSTGIAIQNIPEGAIVSLPYDTKKSKLKTFMYGVLSGVVEPVAVIITVLLSNLLVPVLPIMLSFAAGAMIYVVLKELVPDFSGEGKFRYGLIFFFTGFVVMMSLDVALG